MNLSDRKNFIVAILIIALGGAVFLWIKPILPERLFSEKIEGKNIVMDSLMLQAMNEMPEEDLEKKAEVKIKDTISIVPQPEKKIPEKKLLPKKVVPVTPARLIRVSDFNFSQSRKADSAGVQPLPSPLRLRGYTGTAYLNPFYEKLAALEQDSSKTVRIAYYGDSMLDGDLIVQDLRSALQSRFGGEGVGFVSIKSESARSRYSVKHKTSGKWDQSTFMRTVSDSVLYGVNGAIFKAKDSAAAVQYTSSGIKNAFKLNSPRLYYGKGNDTAAVYYRVNKDTLSNFIKLNRKGLLNTAALSWSDLKKLDLDFSEASGVPVYGVDFFNEQGITVDGFSHRGNSGLPLSLMKKTFISRFQKMLDYDLIVLQFGANVLSTSTRNFGWYAKRMTTVVNHLRELYPGIPILIMGTADKGTKIDDQIQTDTNVVRLLSAQQKYAAETQSGFLSLFHLMGGVNSISAWRENKFANADYTHLSPKGSRVMGRLIYDALMSDYNKYALAKAKKQKVLEKDPISSSVNSQINTPDE